MALKFEPPGFAQPRQYPNIGQDLDTIFNQVLQDKIANQQLKQQQQQMTQAQTQNTLQYLGQGFTPQDIQQLSNPQAVTQAYQEYQNRLNAPPTPSGGPLNQSLGQQQSGLNAQPTPQGVSPLSAHIERYVNRMGAMQSLQGRKEESEIGKNVAESAKFLGEASQYAGTGSKLVAERENQLRDELSKSSLPFEQVRDAYAKLLGAYDLSKKNPTTIGDTALLYNTIRILNPGLAVREGNAIGAADAGSLPTQVVTAWNKLVSGTGKLSPKDRGDFVKLADSQYKSQFAQQVKAEENYKNLATGYGVDPGHVVLDRSLATGQAGGQVPQVPQTAPTPEGPIERMGKPKGYSKAIPLISMDGGKTFHPKNQVTK